MQHLQAERMLSIAVALESGALPDEARWLYERVVELERIVRASRVDELKHDKLFQENCWLREVIARVAQDLDRLGAQSGRTQEATDLLLARAALMRKQANDGPPQGWRAIPPDEAERSTESSA